MTEHRQLHWVAKNRAPRETTARVAEFVDQVIRAASRTDGATLAMLGECLGEVIDEESARHCRLLAVRNGRLIVGVDAPSMVSMMKTRWHKPFLAAIRAKAARSRIFDVGFEFGAGGVAFTQGRRGRLERATNEASDEMDTGTIYG